MKNRPVFRGEAAKICDIDPKTWDKAVQKRQVPVGGTEPPKKKWYWLSDVLDFKKRIPKDRKNGLPLIIETERQKKKSGR